MACEMEVEYCSRNYLEFDDLLRQKASSPTFSREGIQKSQNISPAKSQINGICGCRSSNELCCHWPMFSGSRHQSKELKRKYLIMTNTNQNANDEHRFRESFELPSKRKCFDCNGKVQFNSSSKQEEKERFDSRLSTTGNGVIARCQRCEAGEGGHLGHISSY